MVKHLGTAADGSPTIGGYLIRFSDAEDPDLEGDFFTQDTNFGTLSTTRIYYEHGQDPTIGKKAIGSGTLRADEIGIWVEAQLDARSEYLEAILKLIGDNALQWSSGTLGHLVERVPVGKAFWIKQWLLGEDASLTVRPAEPKLTQALIVEEKTLEEETKQQNDSALAELRAEVATLREEMKNIPAPVRSDVGFYRDDTEVKAFTTFLRTGAAKNLATSPNSAGGYLVPPDYANEVVRKIQEMSPIRQVARVLSVSGTNMLRIPTMTYTTAAVKTPEATQTDEKTPTVGAVDLTAYYYSRITRATRQMLAMDFDIFGQVIAPDIANAFSLAENIAFATGTGIGEPQGVVTAASLGHTAASSSIAVNDLIDLFYSLGLYRTNAVWLMHSSTEKAIRKLTTTTGEYLWQPSLASDRPNTLLGRPVFTLDTMPTIATGTRPIVFGDMSYFYIADFDSFALTVLQELYARTNEVGYQVTRAMDSRIVNTDAIKYLVMP